MTKKHDLSKRQITESQLKQTKTKLIQRLADQMNVSTGSTTKPRFTKTIDRRNQAHFENLHKPLLTVGLQNIWRRNQLAS